MAGADEDDLAICLLFDQPNEALQVVRHLAKRDELGGILVPSCDVLVEGLPLSKLFYRRRHPSADLVRLP